MVKEIRVEFSDKKVTAWGGMKLMKDMLDNVGLKEFMSTLDLPEKAIRLAHSENYQNQAFQIGSAVGLQFHLEVNAEMVNLWLDKTQEKLEQITYIDPQKIRSDIDENISIVKNNMNNFYNNFKSSFHL